MTLRVENAESISRSEEPRLHPLLQATFSRFNGEGIVWCLLRGEERLDDPSGDVDLLVAEEHIDRAGEVLRTSGFIAFPSRGRGSQGFLAYHASTRRWIELDMVTALSFGPNLELETDAARGCLQRRIHWGELFVLDREDAFWALLLRCVVDKGAVSADHAGTLTALAQQFRGVPGGWQPAEFPAGWNTGRAIDCAARADWACLLSLREPLMSGWRGARRGRLRVLQDHMLRLADRPLTALTAPAISVALIGPDGSGKSALARAILDSWYLPARNVYMGLWKRGPQEVTEEELARMPAPYRFLKQMGDAVARPVKAWGRFAIGSYHQRRGRLVVFDRYTFDARLPPPTRLGLAKRMYFWFLGHSCPDPDLTILLDAPGQLMYDRNGEGTPNALEVERQKFLDLSAEIASIHVIDASEPKAVVLDQAMRMIWKTYSQRSRGAPLSSGEFNGSS